MKARLLQNNGSMQLLLCTGIIKMISLSEAKEFLLSFDDPAHYDGPDTWDYDGVTMEGYTGDTIALVEDTGILSVIDGETFRSIVSYQGPKLLTAPEYGKLHGKKAAIVRRFCLQGRIKGAIQKGGYWLIPEDAPYPVFEEKIT